MENQNIQNQNTQQQKMQVQIEELEKRVATLGKKVKEGANTQELQNQISQAQADIETMQTNLINATNIATGVQSQVQTNTTNIGQNASKITGNSNKITNLTTRMSNAETSILALTGGIDVGAELDTISNKINDIEVNYNLIDYYLFKDFQYGFTPQDRVMYTREYHYKTEKGSCTSELIKLFFTAPTNTDFTITLLHNRTIVKTLTFSTNTFSDYFELEYNFIADYYCQIFRIKIESTNLFTLNSVHFKILGRNIKFFRYDNDIKVMCYNNLIYITKYENDCIKCGKFAATDEIDFNNLPLTFYFSDDLIDGCTYVNYMPFVDNYLPTNSTYQENALWRENINGNMQYIYFDSDGNKNILPRYYWDSSTIFQTGYNKQMCGFTIKQDFPCYFACIGMSDINEFYAPFIAHEYVCVHLIIDNSLTISNPLITLSKIRCLVQKYDDYLYYLEYNAPKKFFKICKAGAFVSSYYYNTYIVIYTNYAGIMKKYKLILSGTDAGTVTLEKIFENTDIIYETFNNKLIKRTMGILHYENQVDET